MAYGTSSKRKSSLTVFLMLFLFILCIIPTLFVGIAFADGGGDNPGNGDTNTGTGAGDDDDPHDLADVYYITDYDGDGMFYSDLTNYIPGTFERYYWAPDEFEDKFKEAYKEGTFKYIKDSHVIFEIRSGFRVQLLTDDCIIKVLENFFKELKDRDCQIMFICGTDGHRLGNVDKLLDYVDIHVDTDLFFTFLSSIFNDVYVDCGYQDQINHCTFIIDNNFGLDGGSAANWYESKFFREYFLTFIKGIYQNLIQNPVNPMPVATVLDVRSIKVLYNTSGTEYYDVCDQYMNNPVYIDKYDSFKEKYMDNQNVYAIGNALDDEAYYLEWLDNLKALQSETFVFPIHVYTVDAEFNVENNVHRFGKMNEYEIIIMADDFYNDEDLTKYDNTYGRCKVTHKMKVFTIDNESGESSVDSSWKYLYGYGDETATINFPIDAWYPFMDEPSIDYYYGTNNIY
ncbi:MAG: hypothetical protein J1F71_07000 [Clostridiales bacterium]|nr:hypothetical protein [Clostridiales bacterium]